MAGILTEYFGWYSAFYVPAVVAALVTVVWFALVYDSPAQHPRIDAGEQEYIEKSLGDAISKKKVQLVKYVEQCVCHCGGACCIMVNCVFCGSYVVGATAIYEPDNIIAIPIVGTAALWQFMGPILPDNRCAAIHERREFRMLKLIRLFAQDSKPVTQMTDQLLLLPYCTGSGLQHSTGWCAGEPAIFGATLLGLYVWIDWRCITESGHVIRNGDSKIVLLVL